MILVQQKIQSEEYISIAPEGAKINNAERLWCRTVYDDELCDDLNWEFVWEFVGCIAVRPARYIRLSQSMFIYDDPFAEYQLPIPASVYEYVGLPDTGLHDNAINEVVDHWFNKDGDSVNIQGQPS